MKASTIQMALAISSCMCIIFLILLIRFNHFVVYSGLFK